MKDRGQSDKAALSGAITKRPSRRSVCQLIARSEVGLLWMPKFEAN